MLDELEVTFNDIICPCIASGDWSSVADSTYDLVLSSGFLAFASHSGFLKAVDKAGLPVGGVMGTSAGALSGSLYSAGYSPDQACDIAPNALGSHITTYDHLSVFRGIRA
jgi:predicted acylesterase/phospholipase RssA